MKTLIMQAIVVSGTLFAAIGANAATIALTQTTADPIAVGDTVRFTLATEADFPENIGFSSTLTYDADALSLVSIDIDAVFGFGVAELPVGASGVTMVSPIFGGLFGDATVSGAQDLAVFEFTALTAGTTSLSIGTAGTEFSLSPSGDPILVADALASLTVAGGVTPPAPIPLPAPALMLLSAMAALGVARVRRRTRPTA